MLYVQDILMKFAIHVVAAVVMAVAHLVRVVWDVQVRSKMKSVFVVEENFLVSIKEYIGDFVPNSSPSTVFSCDCTSCEGCLGCTGGA